MQIDIPNMRAEFYDAYFGRYLRPIRDHIWFNMERLLPVLSSPIGRLLPSGIVASLFGIVDPPKIAKKFRWSISPCTPHEAVQKKPCVVLLQDSFTAFFRPQVIEAFISLARHLKKDVALLHYKPSGKAFHIRGNLSAFKNIAQSNLDWLQPVMRANIPIVGIEPATTLLWRDEYAALSESENIQVMLPQEWLINQDLSTLNLHGKWKLFPHCIEKAQTPGSQIEWQTIFNTVGGELELIETACCGMGGLFGHEQEHKKQSLAIWHHHWVPHTPQQHNSLVTGYSCHSQAKRAENISLLHPLEILTNSIPPQ
jgi:Fe-S oxidoreductase